MPDALTIEFALSGVDKVTSAFTQLGKMADGSSNRMSALTASLGLATTAQRALNAETEKYNRLQTGGGSAAINIGRGRVPTSGGMPAEASSRSPSGLPPRGNTTIEQALGGPKGLGDKLADVIKTSRISFEGGKGVIQPLVGKTLGLITEALGPELLAVAGPVGLVVGAATEAAKAIFDLAKASAEAGAAYAKFTYSIGNNGAGAAGALSVGRMAGLDANGTASLAESLNSAITGSAMGHIYGYRVGVMNQAGPWGNVNHADNLVKAIEGLRGIKDFSERVRATNALGLQGASAAIMIPQKQYDLGKQDAAVTRSIMDQDFQEKSLAFQGALGRASAASDNLQAALGKPLLGALTDFENGLANTTNRLATWLGTDTGKGVMGGLATVAGGPIGALAASGHKDDALGLLATIAGGPLGGLIAGAGAGGDSHAAALDRNTAALNNMAGRYNQPGVYGRDTDGRLGRALPAGLGYGGDSTGDAFRGYSQRRAEYMRSGYALSAF